MSHPMSAERIAELRALVQGLRNAAEMSHTSDQDDAADALTEALDAIERVREACKAGSYVDHEWSPTGVRVVMVSEILAALEGKSNG